MSQASVISGAFKQPFKQQVAFFRGKLGNLMPTEKWDDITKSAHDKGFMVAGAAKADLLADLATAVDRTLSEGKSIEAFRKDFRAIVKKRGWHGWTGEGSKKGEAWRTRIIFQTNMNTSYSAGRLAQLRQAGFAFWIYHHNDSVKSPRPLHKAWDAMVLPSDAPWWKTHYTPNGWGCRCYITGAHSKAAAKLVGGKPDKKPDPAWHKTDPKTGAPVGIDKGWDYMPGDTVSDAVQTMAKKTQQWEYTIAKAYMQDVPLSVRDDLAKAYRDLQSVADDVRRYAQAALAARDVAPYRTIGLLTSADMATVQGLSKDVKVGGFDFSLDKSSVMHVLEKHGNAKSEANRGQRAVVASDYALIPSILNNPDSIISDGLSGVGNPVFLYQKIISGELYTVVLEYRKKRKMLALQTFYIKPEKK
ncbi:MAG: phage minor head protein [Ghiorsea sp.]|nr:phage minor head protein [Ghiorsea sp.]